MTGICLSVAMCQIIFLVGFYLLSVNNSYTYNLNNLVYTLHYKTVKYSKKVYTKSVGIS